MLRVCLPVFLFATAINGFVSVVEAQGAKKGGDKSSLPELTTPELDDVSLIDDTLDLSDSWTYQPDIVENLPKPVSREISIGLPMYTRGLACSAEPHGIVAAIEDVTSTDGRQTETQKWSLHRYKLATGQPANPIVLYSKTEVVDRRRISNGGPDFERLRILGWAAFSIGRDGRTAVVGTNQAGRLDVWSLKGKSKHIAAWKPYANEQDTTVLWAHALSDDLVLTLNGSGKLIQWKLPACKAVWQRDFGRMYGTTPQNLGVSVVPGLSPSHRHLAIWSGTSLLLVDSESGKTLAACTGVNGAGIITPTFHRDGTKLACTESENLTQVLVIYDLKTGAELSRIPIPNEIWWKAGNSAFRYGGFTWLDDRYGVVGGTLIVDLDAGRPVWKFDVPEPNPFEPAFSRSGPDFWYYDISRGKSLNAIKLPHAEALDAAKKAPGVFVAGPGSTISVDIRVQGSDEVKKLLEEGLAARLKQLGFTVAQGQRVTLLLGTEIRNTGEQAIVETRRGPFRSGGEGERVTIQAIVLRLTMRVDGQTVWSRSTDFLPNNHDSWKPDPKKSAQEELLEIQWSRVRRNGASFFACIPGYVTDPKAQASFPSGPYPMPKGGPPARR